MKGEGGITSSYVRRGRGGWGGGLQNVRVRVKGEEEIIFLQKITYVLNR